jgi:hypothetical protein
MTKHRRRRSRVKALIRDRVLWPGGPVPAQLVKATMLSLLAAGLLFVHLDHGVKENLFIEGLLAVAIAVIGLTGGWVVARHGLQHERRIGWLLLIASAGAALVFSTDYATYAFTTGRAGGRWVAWLGDLLFFPGAVVALGLLLLLLPDGRVARDPIMKVASGGCVGTGVVILFAKAFEPRLYAYSEWEGGRFSASPLAHIVSSNAVGIILVVGYAMLGSTLLIAAAALYRRMHWSETPPDHHRRLKWFEYSVLLIMATIIPLAVYSSGVLVTVAGAAVALSVPYVTYHALATSEWPARRLRHILILFLFALVAGGGHAIGAHRLEEVTQAVIPGTFLVTLVSSVVFQSAWSPTERLITRLLDVFAAPEDLLAMVEEDVNAIAERVRRAQHKETKAFAKIRKGQSTRDAVRRLSVEDRTAMNERIDHERATARHLERIQRQLARLTEVELNEP